MKFDEKEKISRPSLKCEVQNIFTNEEKIGIAKCENR
jgi:hypothetical protein